MPSNYTRSAVDSAMIRSRLCTISPYATITDTPEKMCGLDSMALVVFDGTPLGVLAAEHILQALADPQNPETTMVADILTAALQSSTSGPLLTRRSTRCWNTMYKRSRFEMAKSWQGW